MSGPDERNSTATEKTSLMLADLSGKHLTVRQGRRQDAQHQTGRDDANTMRVITTGTAGEDLAPPPRDDRVTLKQVAEAVRGSTMPYSLFGYYALTRTSH